MFVSGPSDHFATICPIERFDPRHLPDDWTADDKALLQAIDDATATPIHIAYRLAPEWADGIHAVIDGLETLTPRRPRIAIELVEHTLTRLDQADLDDSDGWLMQFCRRLTVLHTEASAAAGLPIDEIAVRRTRIQTLDLRPFDGLVGLD
ncbi:MAG: hypothetical protein JWR63_274 [Conexibacter sp.]|nr:hypothetical protein [Conexibacter sp.]